MALTVEQMDDLTTSTLRNLTKRKMSQMATTMQTEKVSGIQMHSPKNLEIPKSSERLTH